MIGVIKKAFWVTLAISMPERKDGGRHISAAGLLQEMEEVMRVERLAQYTPLPLKETEDNSLQNQRGSGDG